MKKGQKRGYKYRFEQTKKFRFKHVIKNKRFLKEHKDLLKGIKGLNEKDKSFKIFVFSLRWGISWKVNPRKNYEENNRILQAEMLFPPPISLELETPILDCKLNGTFVIDLEYSDRAIVSSFQEQLKFYRKIYKEKLKGKASRSRLNEYERYITVYQSHENGKSFDKLANKYYNDEDLNYRKRKVKRDYLRGKKLFENHFRQIR